MSNGLAKKKNLRNYFAVLLFVALTAVLAAVRFAVRFAVAFFTAPTVLLTTGFIAVEFVAVPLISPRKSAHSS